MAIEVGFDEDGAADAKYIATDAGFVGEFNGTTGDEKVVFNGAGDDDGVAGEGGIVGSARKNDTVPCEGGETMDNVARLDLVTSEEEGVVDLALGLDGGGGVGIEVFWFGDE